MLAPLLILGLGLLLVVAGSAVEVALFSLARARLQELLAANKRGARALDALRARPASLLATVWCLRVTGAVLAAVAAWQLAVRLARGSPAAVALALAVAVLATVLAELAGMTLGQSAGERFCLASAMPLRFLSRILLPVTWPAELISRLSSPKFAEVLPGISTREIRDMLSPGDEEATIDEHERRLIERTLLLDQTTAYDVMTPRVDIVAWSESQTLAGIAAELRTSRYSRIPLYKESIDEITGVLYTRDAFQALVSGQRDVQLKELAREPFFVPGSVTLDKLLLDFQTRRIHMGIVIDEYGGVDGLIALEDILEELVGEIEDETDIAQEPIIRLSRNVILVDGSADLREVNHFFNTTFPLLEHRSLNGYLLDLFGQVPQPGERITKEGVVIEVMAASDTQVLRARLTRVTPHSARDEGGADLEGTPLAARDDAGRQGPAPRG